MKTISINSRELQYEVCVTGGEYGDYYYTKFYEGSRTTTRKKYYLFGDMIPVVKPNFVFELWFNIESEKITKKECKDKVSKALREYDEKQKRFAEIKNGQVV